MNQPECEHDNLESDELAELEDNSEREEILRPVYCKDCGKKFWEVYMYSTNIDRR